MILVTGASGFVGTRLCEHLRLGLRRPVRALVHRPERAVRVARLDVELVRGDLADRGSLERAVAGCDAVVHCAYGSEGDARRRRFLTGEATGLLADAARAAGVHRFVHLSSVAVWGFTPSRTELDETVSVKPTGHPYVDGKIDAERELAARNLPTVILRPTNVFGPWAPAFTAAPVAAIRAGEVAIVGDGAGAANTLFVDNLCHAIVRALDADDAVGETFVVSDLNPPTWRELYEAYARAAGVPLRSAPPPRTSVGARLRAAALELAARPAVRTAARRIPGARRAARAAVRDAPPVSPELLALQTTDVRYRIEKARRVLGYDPPVSYERALAVTEEWLRFARLV